MCRLRRPIKYVRFANTLLITYYLLPITSNFFFEKILVGQSGLEPPTSRLSVVCSNQLSYWPVS